MLKDCPVPPTISVGDLDRPGSGMRIRLGLAPDPEPLGALRYRVGENYWFF